jgi:HlyD family secretion protein
MLQKTPEPEAPVQPETVVQPDLAAILKASNPQRRIWRYVGIAVVALVVVAGAWAWNSSRGTASAVTYTTAPVTRGDLTVTVAATGTLQPINQVDISSELSGTIATVDADFNDTVKQNQSLATLKTDNLAAAVKLAQATLEARQADVQTAQATVEQTAAVYTRSQKLTVSGVDSQTTNDAAKADSDRAVAGLASAKANLDIAQANLDIAQSNLDKAQILSPINGVVLNRTVEVGQTVASSLQAPVLFTLAEDLAKMEVQVAIDEADMGKVAVGDQAGFTVEAFPGRSFPATISQVRLSPVTVEGVVTYTAILTVDNTDLSLRPGMTATANITVDQVKGSLLVPNAALRYAPPVALQRANNSNGGVGLLGLLIPSRPRPDRTTTTPTRSLQTDKHVLWVLRDGKPTREFVTVGVTDGTRTAVSGGTLAEGDQVITAAKTAS